jgi:hypothetical protein
MEKPSGHVLGCVSVCVRVRGAYRLVLVVRRTENIKDWQNMQQRQRRRQRRHCVMHSKHMIMSRFTRDLHASIRDIRVTSRGDPPPALKAGRLRARVKLGVAGRCASNDGIRGPIDPVESVCGGVDDRSAAGALCFSVAVAGALVGAWVAFHARTVHRFRPCPRKLVARVARGVSSANARVVVGHELTIGAFTWLSVCVCVRAGGKKRRVVCGYGEDKI